MSRALSFVRQQQAFELKLMHLHGNVLDYFIVFGSGIIVSFTPCVYPVLPITVAAISGANTNGSRLNGFLLSTLYVLGIAISYSSLAVIAVLTGKVFGSFQTNPWVMFAIGNTMLLFAFIMADIINFPVLNLSAMSSKLKGPWAIFVLGVVAGFMVGPCTAPILGTLLLYIASKQNLVFGFSLIFVFAYGLGFSLILAGTFSGLLAALPRSGRWLTVVKRVVALIFLILAEFYLIRAGQLM